jgi:hypothetical protein
MKTTKFLSIYLFLLSVLSISCSVEDELAYETNSDLISEEAEVLETYFNELPENVTKIEKVTSKHPRLGNSSLISENLRFNESKNAEYENAIYYFTNDEYATLSYDGKKVYASVFNINDVSTQNLVANFSEVISKNIVTIKYLDSGITNVISIGSTNKSWGSCMDDAIDRLYDDWEDDPAGTLSCWLTGPLCVIGGGIACGIQQL